MTLHAWSYSITTPYTERDVRRRAHVLTAGVAITDPVIVRVLSGQSIGPDHSPEAVYPKVTPSAGSRAEPDAER